MVQGWFVDFRMRFYHGSRQRGAVGAAVGLRLFNPFNCVEMKYYYYVVQFSQPFGFSNQSGLYRNNFFDYNELKKLLEKDGVINPVLTFFKEITEQEYLSFALSFKNP
jgi:hypothetical protein